MCDVGHLERATEIAKEAIAQDEKHEYKKAHWYYCIALDYLKLALKHETGDMVRPILQSKIDEYTIRVQRISEFLDETKGGDPQALTERVRVLEREVAKLGKQVAFLESELEGFGKLLEEGLGPGDSGDNAAAPRQDIAAG